ncbi:MAG: hypothetical protein J6R90_01890 [Alistipes sp.]|nr:hypothetical protein [Alistipes sp.]
MKKYLRALGIVAIMATVAIAEEVTTEPEKGGIFKQAFRDISALSNPIPIESYNYYLPVSKT